jgi:hypothetical protein
VQGFVQFATSGSSHCERLKNAVYVLPRNEAILPTKFLLAGLTVWNVKHTN